jgi:deoxyribodipyrimidine photo-lyase
MKTLQTGNRILKAKSDVPLIRIQEANNNAVNPQGDFVLYWMIAFRRLHWNFSLQRAVDWAKELKKPLVILEALRCGHKWASDRLHGFILDGMVDHTHQLKGYNAYYYPYVESKYDEGKGLLEALAAKSCVVITDDFPAFFIPRMVGAAATKIPVLLETIDSNGLLPMRTTDRVFTTAYSFRRFLQKTLPDCLLDLPKAQPLKGARLPKLKGLPSAIQKRWPIISPHRLGRDSKMLNSLPIDHEVGIVEPRGGPIAAQSVLKEFLENRLTHYEQKRNQPGEKGTSGLSPYLHFGHISAHQVFHELMETEGWSFDRLSGKATGSKSGWWGMQMSAEAFLDELITWRELGFNMCWQRDDYDQYASLPQWARQTLKVHDTDKRQYMYTLEEFEKGLTHDPLWNAAQMQLLREGRIHSYLRMLWGKKILQWSDTPKKALKIMIELNNKYALDGRDPNSYSGIFWVLGRYDRPWGPERPVFGKIRYMSSKNTARKVNVKDYMERYSP